MFVMRSDEQAIFEVARKLDSAAARAAYLHQVRGSDEALARRVEALLTAYEKTTSFLESPAVLLGAQIYERAGTVIGPYKLLERIGEGGMGVVWRAEQMYPVHRKVAVKVAKPGLDSRQVTARFQAERQALAMMDHVNIARVLDGGTTGQDECNSSVERSYFVMELVHGAPITKYCDDNNLSPRERLELFIPVCRAIHHAHQKGIIHRDIKPSNVLVTLHDGKPVPKVIDFGIARATDQKLTERTLHTQFGMMVGTLEYMSPEQAEPSSAGIDTRTDIYSLGVLLYELLTGSTPLTHERCRGVACGEILRIIKEEEPQKPSTRLSDSGETLVSISALRDTTPVKLTRLMRGELDWIVMRSLEKDRERRYETASAFAADIERYLRDEPVQACPPSAWYRLRKCTRRHKVELTVATAVATAVLVAAGSLGWIVHDRQTRLGSTIRQVTEALGEVELLYRNGKLPEAALAARTAHRQLQSSGASEDLRQRAQDWLADLDMVDKLEEIRFRWTDDEAGYFRDFHKAFCEYGIDVLTLPVEESAARIAARPIRLDLAAALDVWALSNDPTFDQALRPKLARIARLADPDPLRDRLRDVGTSAVKYQVQPADFETQPLATLELLTGAFGAAEHRIAFLFQLHERFPDNFRANVALGFELCNAKRYSEAVRFGTAAVALRPNSGLAHFNLGRALRNQGSPDEAIMSLRAAIRLNPNGFWAHNELGLALLEKGLVADAIAAHRESIRLQPDFAGGYDNLGSALSRKGLLREAIAAYREAIRLRPEHAMAHYNLGCTLIERGDFDEAMACFREAIRLKPDYASAYVNLGVAQEKKGLTDQAVESYREAIRRNQGKRQAHYNLGLILLRKGAFDQAIEPLRAAIRLAPDEPRAHYNLALALQARGLPEEAIVAYREAIRLRPEYAEAHLNLGVRFAKKGLLDDSVACYREALRLKPEMDDAHFNLGLALKRKGELDEAAGAFREAHELRRKALGADHVNTLLALDERINVHLAQDKHVLAEPLLRERLRMYEKDEPNSWRCLDCMSKLGACLAVQRKFEEAEPLLFDSYEGMKLRLMDCGTEVSHAARLVVASERLARLYDLWGMNDKADQWRKQLEVHKQERDSDKR